MQIAFRSISFTALALGIAGVIACGQADASGFQLRENSVKNLGRANAGTAVASDDASVVANNPAAMVNLKKTTFQADVSVIDLTAKFDGGGNAAAAFGPAAPALTGGDGGDPGEPTAVPALAIVLPMHGALEGLTLGASVHAPFGLKTEYDADWVGRYNAIKSDVNTVDLTFSAAVAVTDRFSIGAGLIYQHADVTLSNAVDFGTALCAGSGNPANCFNPAFPFHPQGADGRLSVTGDDNGMGWLAGVQWRPTDNFSIGYSHRSEIDHDLQGEVDFTLPAVVAGALGPGAPADGPITAPLTTPSTDTLSAQWDFNDSFRLMADVQRTDWHSLQAVRIYRENANHTALGNEPFNWKDTTYIALGGEWDLSDSFTFRAGIAKDESPTNDQTRTPRLPDNDRMLYSLGMTWNVSQALSIDAAYQRITIDTPSINIVSTSGSRLVGEFDGHADLFGIAAQYRF
jgi:long-chain fatty acid transport protein